MLASSSVLGHPRRHRHPNNILRVPLSTFVPYRNCSHPPPPPNHVFSNPNTRFPPSHVYLSAIARLPPPPHVYPSAIARLPPPLSQFEPERSLLASTMSIRAQSLVSYFKRVISSPNACCLPPPCLFKCNHTSSTSIISNAHFPSRPCLFELGHSSPASTVSN